MFKELRNLFNKRKKEVKQKAKDVYTSLVEKLEDKKNWIKTYPPIKLNQVDWVTPNMDLRKQLEKKGIKAPDKKCLRLEVQDEAKTRTFQVVNSDGSFTEVITTKWYKWADPDAVQKDREELERLNS